MPSEIDLARLGLLALAWLGYFLIHSALASLAVKRWVAARFRSWMPGYRLAFNALAVLLLIPPLALTYAERGPWFWQWTGVGWWVSNGLAAAALLAIVWSLRWYDGQEFLGLRQWRGRVRRPEDQERFHLSPLHRFVRHPWYSLGLVLIWTRDMDPAFLLTAIMVSLYLAIGARLEEAKLLVYHGEVYRRYRERVPSLIPLPWRYLRAETASGCRASFLCLGATSDRKPSKDCSQMNANERELKAADSLCRKRPSVRKAEPRARRGSAFLWPR